MAPIYGRLDHSASTSLFIVPKEANRVRIPRQIPDEIPASPTTEAHAITSTGQPPAILHFSRGDGLLLLDLLFGDPQELQQAGLDYYQSSDIPRTISLHITWPGYRKHTRTSVIEHDGTYGSIALGVARAYRRFLEEAREWEFEREGAEDPLWDMQSFMCPSFDVFSLRLLSLVWVSQNAFQAEVDYVLRD